MRNAEPAEFIKAFVGLDFPTSKAAVMRKAHDKGGLDTEVIHVLQLIPDRTYDTPEDLNDAVMLVYDRGGALGDAGPAAPGPESDADKGLIQTAADPRAGEDH